MNCRYFWEEQCTYLLYVLLYLLYVQYLSVPPSSFPEKKHSPVSSSLLFLISSPNYLIRITDSAKQEHELQERKGKKRKPQYKTTTPKILSVGLNENVLFLGWIHPGSVCSNQ